MSSYTSHDYHIKDSSVLWWTASMPTFRRMATRDRSKHWMGCKTQQLIFEERTTEIVWQAWLHQSKLRLPVEMEYDLTLANPASALGDRWYESWCTTDISKLDFKSSDLDSLDANQRGARQHVLLFVLVEEVGLQLSSSNNWRVTMNLFLQITFSISISILQVQCTSRSPKGSSFCGTV